MPTGSLSVIKERNLPAPTENLKSCIPVQSHCAELSQKTQSSLIWDVFSGQQQRTLWVSCFGSQKTTLKWTEVLSQVTVVSVLFIYLFVY